jgi:hypothetical protein
MKNFFSKIAETIERQRRKPMRGSIVLDKSGKKAATSSTLKKMNRQLKAPTDIGELSGYLKQVHNKAALVAALRRMKMPVSRKNLKLANTALSMQAMAKTRNMKNPSFGFDTSLQRAFKDALRRRPR